MISEGKIYSRRVLGYPEKLDMARLDMRDFAILRDNNKICSFGVSIRECVTMVVTNNDWIDLNKFLHIVSWGQNPGKISY